MNRLDLIIDALESAHHTCDTGVVGLTTLRLDTALAAARELKDELYIKEMEQPTPKQSGKMSITALRLNEVKHD